MNILKALSVGVLLFLIRYGEGIRSDFFCSKNEKSDCNTEYSYNCDRKYCGKQRVFCDYLINLRHLVKSIISQKLMEESVRKYSSLTEKIKPCKEQKPWKPNDICKNGRNCYHNQTLNFRMGPVKVLKETPCRCAGKYEFTCQEGIYCGTSKFACIGIENQNFTKPEYKAVLKSIKGCRNDNQSYKFKVPLLS